MSKFVSLQDFFLSTLRREKMQVSIYLVNGIKLLGHVEAFDNFVVILGHNNTSQVVYKHSISTIVPAQPMRITWNIEQQGDDHAEVKTTEQV